MYFDIEQSQVTNEYIVTEPMLIPDADTWYEIRKQLAIFKTYAEALACVQELETSLPF